MQILPAKDKFSQNGVAQCNVLGERGIGHAKTAKPVELPFDGEWGGPKKTEVDVNLAVPDKCG